MSTLNEGAKVSYEEKENRGKISAENLRVGTHRACRALVPPNPQPDGPGYAYAESLMPTVRTSLAEIYGRTIGYAELGTRS
jgi:hypothetical protein